MRIPCKDREARHRTIDTVRPMHRKEGEAAVQGLGEAHQDTEKVLHVGRAGGFTKMRSVGPGEKAQRLRACSTFEKERSLFPSPSVGRLTCNSSSSGFHRHMHIHRDAHRYIKFKTIRIGVGEMARDLVSVSSTQWGSPPSVSPVSGETNTLFGPFRHCKHVVHMHAYIQANIYTQNKTK